jgi:hypothetical protein
MKKLHSTQFETEEPLSEDQASQEIHWLSYSMALRGYEKKAARMERQAVRARRPPLDQLWAKK